MDVFYPSVERTPPQLLRREGNVRAEWRQGDEGGGGRWKKLKSRRSREGAVVREEEKSKGIAEGNAEAADGETSGTFWGGGIRGTNGDED